MPWNKYRLDNNKQILRKHPPKEFFLNEIVSAKFATLLKYPLWQMFFRKVFWSSRSTTLKSRALQEKRLMKYLDFNTEIFIPLQIKSFQKYGLIQNIRVICRTNISLEIYCFFSNINIGVDRTSQKSKLKNFRVFSKSKNNEMFPLHTISVSTPRCWKMERTEKFLYYSQGTSNCYLKELLGMNSMGVYKTLLENIFGGFFLRKVCKYVIFYLY